MTDEKEIRFKKTWTVEVTEYKDGTMNMSRSNDGFSVMELLGVTTMVQNHLLGLMESIKDKPDSVNVSSTNSPVFHHD